MRTAHFSEVHLEADTISITYNSQTGSSFGSDFQSIGTGREVRYRTERRNPLGTVRLVCSRGLKCYNKVVTEVANKIY